jgi:hypothetical protein
MFRGSTVRKYPQIVGDKTDAGTARAGRAYCLYTGFQHPPAADGSGRRQHGCARRHVGGCLGPRCKHNRYPAAPTRTSMSCMTLPHAQPNPTPIQFLSRPSIQPSDCVSKFIRYVESAPHIFSVAACNTHRAWPFIAQLLASLPRGHAIVSMYTADFAAMQPMPGHTPHDGMLPNDVMAVCPCACWIHLAGVALHEQVSVPAPCTASPRCGAG